MSAQQQVITIDDISVENAPAIYVSGGLKQFFEHAKAQATGEIPDLTTRKGRERVASLAAEVSRSKTAVEKPGREYLKRLKEMPKVVETELREFVNSMDALRDATRQPLTEWEEAEQARKDKHVDEIQAIRDLATFEEVPTAGHVAQIIADLELLALDDSWEEFLAEAAQVKDQVLAKLRTLHDERARHEAEQAELARLRQEAEARAQADREAEIAREAAELAQREAEDRARAEREAAAQREQALIDAAQRERQDAENQRLQLQLQAEQAERQRVEAEQRAEQERIDSERRQAEAVERAKQEEIDRQKAAADEILRQQREREADRAHKGAIYKSAKEAFMKNGMTEECARLAVKLIASNLIPAVSIQY